MNSALGIRTRSHQRNNGAVGTRSGSGTLRHRTDHCQPLLVEHLATQYEAEVQPLHFTPGGRVKFKMNNISPIGYIRHQVFSSPTDGMSSHSLARGKPSGISAIRSASL